MFLQDQMLGKLQKKRETAFFEAEESYKNLKIQADYWKKKDKEKEEEAKAQQKKIDDQKKQDEKERAERAKRQKEQKIEDQRVLAEQKAMEEKANQARTEARLKNMPEEDRKRELAKANKEGGGKKVIKKPP